MWSRQTSLLVSVVVLASASIPLLADDSAGAAPNDLPLAPTNVTTSASSTSLTLQWTPSAYGGTDGSNNPASVTGYNVYFAQVSGGETLGSPSCTTATTSCEVTALTPGTTYYYEVTTVNSLAAESLPTAEASVVFQAIPHVTLSTSPATPVYLGGSVTLSATLDIAAAGTVDFLVNGADVGCSSQPVSTSGPPYSATCSYTPPSATAFTLDATFTPVDATSFASAAATQLVVPVSPATQAPLSITSLSGTYGSTLSLVTSGGSGTGALSFNVVNGTASNCQVTGNVLSADTAGTCLVTATQASDANYLEAVSPQATVTFAQATQAPLSITSLSGTYGQNLTLTTSGGSGTGSVTYVVSNGPSTTCHLNLGVLSADSTGTCLVTATRAGDANYLDVSSPQTTVTFYESSQSSLSITSLSGTYGSTVTLATSGGSGSGAVSFAVQNGPNTNCLLAGNVLSADAAGTCVVTATKGSDANFAPTSSPPTTITFDPASQPTLSITSISGTYGAAATLTTSGGAGAGTITFAVLGGTARSCKVSGSLLSATSAGTCLVRATKAADRNHLLTTSSSVVFTFERAVPLDLLVTSTSGTYGSALSLVTSGGSGSGAVSYTVLGGSASACRVSGSILTAASAGTCLVQATKSSDADYLANSSAVTRVTINKAAQSRLALMKVQGIYGAATVLRATGGSGTGAVSFAVRNLTAQGCAIIEHATNYSLVAASAGTCLVTAVKATDRNYKSVLSRATPVVISRAPQAAFVLVTTVGTVDSALVLVVRGGTGNGPVSFSVKDGSATKCVLSRSDLVAATAGTCYVKATKQGDRNHVSTRASGVVTFLRLNPSPLILAPAKGTVGTGISLSVSGGSGTGALRFALAGGTSPSCQLTGSTLVSRAVGTCRVIARKKGDGTYRAGASGIVTFNFTHKVVARSIAVSPSTGLRAGDPLSVSGSGFPAHQPVLIAECAIGATSLAQCDRASAKTVLAQASGVLPATVMIAATGKFGTRTCGTTVHDLAGCEVHVSNGTFAHATIVSLTFASAVLGRQFFVTPSNGLKNGDVVTLSGRGFTPHDRVYFAECLTGSISESRCDLATYRSVLITSTG